MTVTELEVLPLTAGDHLSRDEFIQRWEGHPELKLAELIGGTVYMSSPLSKEHANADTDVICWLRHYSAHTPGCEAGSNATWYMLKDAPQPDAHLRVLEQCGGSSWVEGQFLHGAPELIAEICLSSSSYDLHQKLALYRAAGVKEYLAFLLHDREIRWHRLVGNDYQTMELPPDGVFRSLVFPGLWLDVKPLLDGNMAQVLETLQCGLDSSDHAEFIERLASRKP